MLSRLSNYAQMMNHDPLGFVIYLISYAVAILTSLILHECAHGYVAYLCGDPTAKMMGRLDLRPSHHLDPVGTICMVLLGFGWAKPVPVNPRYFRNYRRDDLLVSIAGIVTNFVLCLACMMLSVGALYSMVGGGFVLNDRVINGAHGVAGEVGHIVVNRDEPLYCTCGKRGCVEQYASANGIVRVTKERLAQDDTPSMLREIPELTCKDVFACAAKSDALAKEILERTYDYLGEAIADACCILDPELVIIGGGVSAAGQVLLDGIHRHFQTYMFHACKHTRFALATLGNDAGIYGSFRLISEE